MGKTFSSLSQIVVVLHDVRSIQNVGSIFRTGDAAGVSKIYLCGITPVPLDRFGKARQQFDKVSLGAENYVSWEYARSAPALLKRLQKDGYTVFAVEQSRNSVPYYKMKPLDSARGRNQGKLALIFGNEVRGLSRQILKCADKILEIPMCGKKESLNVSVAFGIVVFHLRDVQWKML